MTSRSVLRIRQDPHFHPDRQDEGVVEVVRDGEVVAFIYGSREGVHVVSARLDESTRNTPFRLALPPSVIPIPGFVVPLLAESERCPWECNGGLLQPTGMACPICNPKIREYRP